MLTLSANVANALMMFRAQMLAGEPVIFPTDTIYGIGAPLLSVKANRRIYEIKNRPLDKPMPVLVSDYEMLHTVTENVTPDILKWLKSIWPGAYTIIFKAKKELPDIYKNNGTIAVRMVSGWLGQAVHLYGCPVTATSVNSSGEAPLLDAGTIYNNYKNTCKFMLYGTSGTKSSSIIDISLGGIKEIRLS